MASVNLDPALASALLGLEILGEKVSRPENMLMHVAEPGLNIQLDPKAKRVTIGGAACTWEFQALDAMIFCMTAPSNQYRDSFGRDRLIWYIERSDAHRFAALVASISKMIFPMEGVFPFLSPQGHRSVEVLVEHGRVTYAPREAVLADSVEGRLAALLFTNATFLKPSGPPRNFEREEEYRFQFRFCVPGASVRPTLPQYIDLPFQPFEHIVRFFN